MFYIGRGWPFDWFKKTQISTIYFLDFPLKFSLENPPIFLSYACITFNYNNSSYTVYTREKIYYILSIDFKIYSPQKKKRRKKDKLSISSITSKGRSTNQPNPISQRTINSDTRKERVGLVALAGQNRSVTEEDTGPTRGVCIDNEGAGGTMSALGDIHDWLFHAQDRSNAGNG